MPLAIVAGGTKSFYGRAVVGEPLEVGGLRGIVAYDPTELVVTAYAGTPLAELDAVLAAQGQMLAFEPPRFGRGATLGGAVATGLSGPRRPYAGAVRDFVLGVRCIDGRGAVLAFGGRVMKNVAGYDVSRLMAGAMGTLGVLVEISLKVLPVPACERTLGFELDLGRAAERVASWSGRPLPLSACCHDGERLRVRLSGTEAGVVAAARELGGEPAEDGSFWTALREHELGFFAGERPLWRVAKPPAAPWGLDGDRLVDWGGAQLWLRTPCPAADVRTAAAGVGGHAIAFRHGDRAGEVFHPLGAGVARLHRGLKQAFDPDGVLNPGRLYPDG